MTVPALRFKIIILSLLVVQILFMMAIILRLSKLPDAEMWRWTTDVGQYFTKVDAVKSGKIPFYLMPLEYPIAALPIIALPALVASTMDEYLVPFILEMVVWNTICFFMVVRWVKREQGGRIAINSASWYTSWLSILAPMWALRIDVPAAMLIFASFSLLVSRPAWAAVIGVLGGYIKLVPLVLVPIAMRQRKGIQTFFLATGIFLLILVLWWLIAQPSMEYAIRYHLKRGIEIGSLYSGILYIIGHVVQWPMFTELRFASTELITPVPQGAMRLIPILQIAAVLYPLFWLKSGTNARNLRLVIAMVLGYILFGKVLSPQYMLWLIPLYAVLGGPQARLQKILFTIVCLATTILYPVRFVQLTQLQVAMMVLLNFRNFLLLWLYWLVVRRETVRSEHPLVVANPNQGMMGKIARLF